jgi:hypothetical protein
MRRPAPGSHVGTGTKLVGFAAAGGLRRPFGDQNHIIHDLRAEGHDGTFLTRRQCNQAKDVVLALGSLGSHARAAVDDLR